MGVGTAMDQARPQGLRIMAIQRRAFCDWILPSLHFYRIKYDCFHIFLDGKSKAKAKIKSVVTKYCTIR